MYSVRQVGEGGMEEGREGGSRKMEREESRKLP